MRAALLEAPGTPLHVVDDVEIEAPGAGQVRVAVKHCGLCHSDLGVIDGTFPAGMPIVVGHEAAGVVVEVGPGVQGLSVGDSVVLTPCPPCGRCYGCLHGEPGVCVNASSISSNSFLDGTTGLSRKGARVYRGLGVGAFAEYVLTPEAGAVKIPSDVPLHVACVIGCAVQTGVGAVINTARVEEGATVLVMGLGGVGLSTVQGARLAGASRVIVSDPVASRREAALRLGATDVLDPAKDDVVSACRDLTRVGVDYAFETAGVASLVSVGVMATRAGGTTVCVGAPPIDQAITIAPAVMLVVAEKKVVGSLLGSCNSARDIPRFVSLWRAGRLDLEGLITGRRPLEQVNEAARDMREGRGIRTVIDL
jgi:Zn-dependent alcohol dehydrogenase